MALTKAQDEDEAEARVRFQSYIFALFLFEQRRRPTKPERPTSPAKEPKGLCLNDEEVRRAFGLCSCNL